MFRSKLITRTLAIIGFIATISLLFYLLSFMLRHIPQGVRTGAALITANQQEERPTTVDNTWSYTFNVEGTLHEAARPSLSSSPYWWLSSGGMLIIEDGQGKTITQTLDSNDEWRWRYGRNNPLDTDDGRFPQNLFRLISKNEVGDAVVSVDFSITAIHLTDTPNRGGYSGFFLMTRYKDSDNLYYAGVRQDGHSVIKKKISGTYYTLAEQILFTSLRSYERNTNPNLLPGQTMMGLRVITTNQPDGSVQISLQLDEKNNNSWREILTATDNDIGGITLTEPGRVGIRSDYMDVSFDDFTIEPL